MLQTYSLKVEKRERMGTGPARELRRRNMVPGIIYGAGKEPVMIALPAKELKMQYFKQGFLSHMFDIEIDSKHKYCALPKEIQLHPVTDEIEHIDFMHIDEKAPIKINVAIHFVNESKCVGLKQGGVLNAIRHSLEVYCLPSNIPESIDIDIAELTIGQSIHVKDLALPKGVETKLDQDITIATIVTGKTTEDLSTENAETKA